MRGVQKVGGCGDPQAWPAQTLALSPQVCEPPESRRPSHRWSVSISERRRLAACERPEHADAKPTPTPSGRDLPRIVAELVSQGVDKDVLLPRPPRSTESTNAFHAFLVRSAPFWRNMTLEAQASRSPPS